MRKNQGGFSIVEILGVIVVVGLLSVAGWAVYDRQKNKSTALQANEQKPTMSTSPADVFEQKLDEIEKNDILSRELFLTISYSNYSNADYLAGLERCISYQEKNTAIVNELGAYQDLSPKQQEEFSIAKRYTELRLLYFKTALQGSLDNNPSAQQELDEIQKKIDNLKGTNF